MKKLLMLGVMVLSISSGVFAAGMDIGVHGGMAWWGPYFQDWVSGDHSFDPYLKAFNKNFTMDPTWQVGPELSFRFTDTVRWVNKYTYSQFTANASFNQLLLATATPTIWSVSQEIKKHNLDSTLDISVHKYVSILLGFKYQNFKETRKDTGLTIGSILMVTNWENVCNSLGGGLGLGLSFDLAENLSLNLDAKAIYLKPLLEMKKNGFRFGMGSLPLIKNFKPIYHTVGMDADLSLAYFIKPASMTLALGCKYQYLYTLGSDASADFLDYMVGLYDLVPKLSKKSDHQVDLYLSAVYNLNFSK